MSREHSSNSPDPTIDLLVRYLAHELDAPDAERLRAAYGTTRDGVSVLDTLRDGVERESRANVCDATLLAHRLREAHATLGISKASSTPGLSAGVKRSRRLKFSDDGHSPRTRLRQWWLTGIGAVMVVAAVLGITQLGRRRHTGTTQTYATTATQVGSLTLIDGTRVTLAPGSTLRLVDFGASARTVVLNGEAFFDVTKSSGAPFVVQAGATQTRVLGTEFLVRGVSGETHAHVAVLSGKVMVGGTGLRVNDVVLTAGDIADVRDSTVHVSATDDALPEVKWSNGEVVFRHAPVPQVLETLTHWYGYHFRCTDTVVTQQQVTVGMSTRSSSEALAMLEQILNVHLTVAGDTVTLTPQSVQSQTKSPRIRAYDVWTPNREVGR